MGAFTHLGDRYGPYQPGASELSDVLAASAGAGGAARAGRPVGPLAGRDRAPRGSRGREVRARGGHGPRRRGVPLPARPGSARSRHGSPPRTCRSTARPGSPRPASSDAGSSRWRPSSWRARPEARSCTPTAARARSLARADRRRRAAPGVEPRGAVALRALERGCRVTISEVVRVPGRPARGLARRPRPERGGRPPAAPRPPSAARPVPARAGARRARSSSSSEPARGADARERPRPTTWSTGRPAPRGRPGSCCSTAADSSTSAPLPAGDRRRPAVRPGGRHALVSGVHHFVPVLHRGDAVGRHTLRLPRRHPGPRVRLEHLRRRRPGRDGGGDAARPLLPRGGPAGRRRRLPVRHRLADGALAGRPDRDAGRQLPQHHAARADGAVGPPPRARARCAPRGTCAVLAPRTDAGRRRLGLQRGAPGRGGLRRHGGRPALGRPRRRRHRGGPRHAAPEPDRPAAAAPAGSPSGRVSPNKALEHTIAALAVARAHGDPDATLRIVGKPATDTYEPGAAALRRRAGSGRRRHASPATPATPPWRRPTPTADVLVVTSEHEGFCVPVVEAMAAGLPVVAFDQGAVPEVLGGAGVLVTDRDPYALAAPSPTCWATPPAATAMAEAGRRRLAELDLAYRGRPLRRPARRPWPRRRCRARR